MFERLDPPEEFRPDEGFRRRGGDPAAGGCAGAATGSPAPRLGTVVVMAAVVGVTAGWSRQQFDNVERVEVQQLPEDRSTRSTASRSTCSWSGWTDRGPTHRRSTGQRADTIMVVRVEPGDAQGAGRVHSPRPVGADRRERAEGRINAALGEGGPAALVGTVEAALGIPVDRYLQIDFDGFREMVDARRRSSARCPVRPIRDGDHRARGQTAGCHDLDGRDALALVRAVKDRVVSRRRWYDDADGDIGRMHPAADVRPGGPGGTRRPRVDPVERGDACSTGSPTT